MSSLKMVVSHCRQSEKKIDSIYIFILDFQKEF